MSAVDTNMFFHMFPGRLAASRRAGRPLHIARHDPEYLQAGCLALRLMLDHGLLLTPEIFKVLAYSKSELAKAAADPEALVQTRACFTYGSLATLSHPYSVHGDGSAAFSHLDLFGGFAIGIDVEEARDLHLTPCTYVYDPVRNGEDSLSAHFVHSLGEIKDLLVMLSHLDAKAHPDYDVSLGRGDAIPRHKLSEFGIRLCQQPEWIKTRAMAAVDALTVEEARRCFDIFELDRRPIYNLVEMLQLLLSVYQRTDSARGHLLAYFRQHEWRLIKLRHSMLVGYDIIDPIAGVTAQDQFSEVREAFLEDLHRFWSETGHPVRTGQQLSDHFVLLGTPGQANSQVRLFRDFIRVVVAPRECSAEVRALIALAHRRRRFVVAPPVVLAS